MKRKKKIALRLPRLLLLFLLCLLFCAASVGSFAAADGGLFSFTYLPDDGAYAVSVSETGRAAASLTLPGSYEGKPVKQIADGGFRGCTALQSVTLPEGLDAIGASAFADCTALSEITLPKGLRLLGSGAFSGCAALKTVRCGDSAKPAGWSADCFAGCSAQIDYAASPSPSPSGYTVTWLVDEEGTTESYAAGEMPSYKGTIEKFSDGQYEYTFREWVPALAPVTGDVTYTAVFDQTPLRYTVTWDVEGELTTESYAAGETPEFKGKTDKKSDEQSDYRFTGWTPEVQPVTGDVTYKATYEATPRKYTVTWIVDGKVTKESYAAGETPKFKGSTEKQSDVGQSYRFTGWDKEPVKVTGDATYTAQFEKGARSYTVTWSVDGTTSTEQYAFGETPAFKGSTEKAATEQITYLFKGWDSEPTPVTADITYTALYEETPRTYTVTWMVDGKRTEESYAYGETPSFKGSTGKESDGQFDYSFKEWNAPPEKVTKDATYVAVYDKTPIEAKESEKSSLLSSPLFWVLIILVALVSAGGIGLMILQKIKRESPEKFPWLDRILAYLPGGTKKEPEEAPRRTREDPRMERSGQIRRTDGPSRSKGTPGGGGQQGSRNAARRGEDSREGSRDPSMESTRRIPPMTTTGGIPAVRDGARGPHRASGERTGKEKGNASRARSASHEKKPSLWDNGDD